MAKLNKKMHLFSKKVDYLSTYRMDFWSDSEVFAFQGLVIPQVSLTR
jgi:hypothetical protein